MRIFKVLWIPSLILIILMVISLVIYGLIPPSWEGVRNFALNLAAGIVGTLLTVFLIDQVLRSKEESEEKEKKRKYQEIALRHLRIPLINHLRMFTNILKAVSQSAPQKSYDSVHDLFDKDYFAKLELLDFSKDAPLLGYKWSDYIARECSRFKESITRTLDRYSLYLDSDIVELMEQIINSSFMDFVVGAPATRELKLRTLPGVVLPNNLFAEKTLYGGGINVTRKYTERFSRLIDYYNSHESEEKRIKPDENYWRSDIAPQYGTGLIQRAT